MRSVVQVVTIVFAIGVAAVHGVDRTGHGAGGSNPPGRGTAALTPAAPSPAPQSPTPQTPTAQTPAAPRTYPLDGQLVSQYRIVRRALGAIAERMPADAYSFRPTADMRTFGEAVEHAAVTARGMCSVILGRKSAVADGDGRAPKPTLAKPDVIKLVNEAFAVCDEYAATLKADTLGETYEATAVAPDGTRTPIQSSRAGLFANMTSHTNEMYGYLAVYLRLKGLVPPTSDPRPGGRGGVSR